MKRITFYSNLIIILSTLLLVCHSSEDDRALKFECLGRKGNSPQLPKAYSTNIKINLINDESTVEIKYARNRNEKKELYEFKSPDRHVKYIVRDDKAKLDNKEISVKSTIYIEYQNNKQPRCEYMKSNDIKDFLRKEDSGEDNFIMKALEVMMDPFQYNIYSTGPDMNTGVMSIRYEGCLKEPEMNISFIFAAKDWKMPYSPASSAEVYYPEMVEAQIRKREFRAYYTNFDPSVPDSSIFQPPADLFCKGFRSYKKPPTMPNYFSYGAEMVNYERLKNGSIVPLIYQRKVFNDYNDKIIRMDFNDLLAPRDDSFTKTIAKKKSIIHDYNSGLQYIIDSFTGKCSLDSLQETFSVISFEETRDNSMLSGEEFFWLDAAETSYNGQFNHRGVLADVYTALRIDTKTKNPYIISWFFSSESTQVAENENVEKNVLLSMYVRPETDVGKEKITEIHFFDFVKEEPDVFDFDLTKCYNETTSKTLVFTFPVHDELRGYEKLVGRLLNIAIKDVTGIRKHRIFTKEVIFSSKYMYTEFSLLENSPTGPADKKISLEDALKRLENRVRDKKFKVNVPADNTTFTLEPVPNGLNIFAGDRPRLSEAEGYSEGSVIGLTLGMLILGFLLGMVSVNMIINKKHGVSLFQKTRFPGSGFGNPLNESSI